MGTSRSELQPSVEEYASNARMAVILKRMECPFLRRRGTVASRTGG